MENNILLFSSLKLIWLSKLKNFLVRHLLFWFGVFLGVCLFVCFHLFGFFFNPQNLTTTMMDFIFWKELKWWPQDIWSPWNILAVIMVCSAEEASFATATGTNSNDLSYEIWLWFPLILLFLNSGACELFLRLHRKVKGFWQNVNHEIINISAQFLSSNV